MRPKRRDEDRITARDSDSQDVGMLQVVCRLFAGCFQGFRVARLQGSEVAGLQGNHFGSNFTVRKYHMTD